MDAFKRVLFRKGGDAPREGDLIVKEGKRR